MMEIFILQLLSNGTEDKQKPIVCFVWSLLRLSHSFSFNPQGFSCWHTVCIASQVDKAKANFRTRRKCLSQVPVQVPGMFLTFEKYSTVCAIVRFEHKCFVDGFLACVTIRRPFVWCHLRLPDLAVSRGLYVVHRHHRLHSKLCHY